MKNKNKRAVEKILSNKTIHVEIPGSIHRKLRALLFLNEISMQKFFTLMAESYVNSDPYIRKLVDQRVEEIKEDKLDKLRNVEKKDLYDAIEKNSPFK
jgi:DNA recombination-dependent growth factor C